MPLKSDNLWGLAAGLAIFGLVITCLVFGKQILLPLAVAALLAFILAPGVRRLARAMPHGLAVAIVLIALTSGMAAATAVLTNQMLSLAAELGTYRANIVEKVRAVRLVGEEDGVFKRAGDAISAISTAIEDEFARPETQAQSSVTSTEPRAPDAAPPKDQPRIVVAQSEDRWAQVLEQLEVILAPLTYVGLTILFTLFLLLQRADLQDRVVRVAGTNNITGATSAMSEAGERLSTLFITQALINSGFGVLMAIALSIIGVPNAVLWGAFAAIMRFVPFIGSILAAVPPILLAAAVDPGWSMVIATSLLFIVGESVAGHVVEPLVLGKRVGLSPLALVIAVSFWTLVWGPAGLILAAPLTMVLVVLGRYVSSLELFSILLGDEPALTPEQTFYHRMLSSDAADAFDQIDKASEKHSLAEIGDGIILPALNRASIDSRWGRLDREDADEFRSTFRAVIDMMELLAPAAETRSTNAAQTALVVPAHGGIDAAASEFVACAIQSETTRQAEAVTNLSGLTALAESSARREAVGTIALVTVGGLQPQHMKFLVRRARRDFPDAQLLFLDASGEMSDRWRDADAEGATRFRSLDKLLEYVKVNAAPRVVEDAPEDRSKTSEHQQARLLPVRRATAS